MTARVSRKMSKLLGIGGEKDSKSAKVHSSQVDHCAVAADILAHEDPHCTRMEHLKTLRRVFDEIDEDKSGSIDVAELGSMLEAQGHKLSEFELKAVMSHLDDDGDGDTLSFKEFLTVMDKLEHGATIADIAQHFTSEMSSIVDLAKSAMPIWELIEQKKNEGEELTKWEQFQIDAGRILDGAMAQVIILALIGIDVVCVICELLILHTECDLCQPTCSNATSAARFLASSSAAQAADISCYMSDTVSMGLVKQNCEPHFSKVQHDWEHYLHVVSVGILGIFAVQLLLLMLIYQFKFFHSAGYVVDTIVVGAALVLENMSAAKEGGLFVALLSWRVLRIIHGIASSVEINSNLANQKVAETTLEIASQHEQKTDEIRKEVALKLLNLAKQKKKVGDAVDEDMQKEIAAETAQQFLNLCDFVESISTQLSELKEDIVTEKEKVEGERIEDKIGSNKTRTALASAAASDIVGGVPGTPHAETPMG